MKYTTVIWDFDGTLADTLGGALEIYNDLAAQYGFDPIDDPETVRSMPLSDLASSVCAHECHWLVCSTQSPIAVSAWGSLGVAFSVRADTPTRVGRRTNLT
ncbi:MAG: HAD hydrolase-like protein, partial [Pirellulaceae bacterium]|nr:HAD hydrolase-like protein [Pirellulaceae bacterium]